MRGRAGEGWGRENGGNLCRAPWDRVRTFTLIEVGKWEASEPDIGVNRTLRLPRGE